MRKFLIGLTALFLSAPAFASLDHWTCSNDSTVLYFILDTDEGNFMMFDDQGGFLAAAKFTAVEKTKNGTPFMYAEVADDLAVGVSKAGDSLVLALTNGKDTAKFLCN